MAIVRGEIYFVNLNPVKGREQSGRRAVLVLSTSRASREDTRLGVIVASFFSSFIAHSAAVGLVRFPIAAIARCHIHVYIPIIIRRTFTDASPSATRAVLIAGASTCPAGKPSGPQET